MNVISLLKYNSVFFIGILLYLVSFFLPSFQFSLGITLYGWEVLLLRLGEIAFINGNIEYFIYLFSSLTNLWVVALIVGFVRPSRKWAFLTLAALAVCSSLYWLFAFQYSAVLLTGYYVWEIGIILIVIGRFLRLHPSSDNN